MITRLVIALVGGLALLAWLSFLVLQETTRVWFEKEVTSRASMAVSGSRKPLLRNLRTNDRTRIVDILEDIARDERVMGTALCTDDSAPIVRTANYPDLPQLSCTEIAARVRPEDGSAPREWNTSLEIASGSIHVSAVPIGEGEEAEAVVILVHDLEFVERRDRTLRRFLLVAFLFLSCIAAGVPVIVARASWRRWYSEMRAMLREGPQRPEFKPLMQDVRELLDRLHSESSSSGGGAWDAERLRSTLTTFLHGEKVVIVANREPYIHEKGPGGEVRVVHPASGLVTALEPVMRACSGVWVAHGSGSADRMTADAHDRVKVPPGEDAYSIRRVWLDAEEEKGYYYGFSNEGLWPLCHIADARPSFRREDFEHYEAVNRRFADAVCEEVDALDPIILVQDYHLALVPRLIRERLPRATIITFWHIPWPNPERFSICPWRNELLEGLLGSSILGFHTQFHCNNFLDAVDRFMEARLDREDDAVVFRGRTSFVRPYPISIDWPNRWAEATPPAAACRESVFRELGLAPDARLGVGVDRLDYTKGIEERLLTVERALEADPHLRGKLVFVQLAAPSRTIIEKYRLLSESVERIARRINERFGGPGYDPIRFLRAHHEPPTVFRYYRAADFCWVSSLHDGMNLVAKEFVAAREDERGVLLLSRFAGAAKELTEALVVNPYDLEESRLALSAALSMSPAEQRDRMRAMRAYLTEFNVYRWAGKMLEDGARLRRRDRLTDRLVDRMA